MAEAKTDHFAYYDYLDALRESAVTNMFGARPYLMEEFPDLSADEALDILKAWMHQPRDQRGSRT